MLLNEHLTWVHTQRDCWLHFGKSFTLNTQLELCWTVYNKNVRETTQ